MCCHLLPSPHPEDQPIHDDHHLLKPELHDFSHHRLHLTTGDWVADGVGEHLQLGFTSSTNAADSHADDASSRG